MDADWSVELTADDATLAMPWRSPDSSAAWLDLRSHPEAAQTLPECRTHPELAEILRRLNAAGSGLVTAKCDVMGAEPVEAAEEIHGAWRFGSYVDFVLRGDESKFSATPRNFDFAVHEQFARALAQRLGGGWRLGEQPAPAVDAELEQLNAGAEIIVRRCWYEVQDGSVRPSADAAPLVSGFYFTLYLFGFGEDESSARQQWVRALAPVADALLKLACELPPSPPADDGRK